MASRLRRVLENRSGIERIYLRLPYIFLPPRFEKISLNRDLVLLLKDDYTLHVRWSGELEINPHPLTVNAALRLIEDVLNNMTSYRKDLSIASRFLEQHAEGIGDGTRDRELSDWDKRERVVERQEDTPLEESLDDLLRYIEEQNLGEQVAGQK